MVDRPDQTEGVTTEIRTGCGSLFITDSKGGGYKEVIVKLGKTGGCQAAMTEALGKLITHAMNAGVSRKKIIRALQGIQCPNPCVSSGVKTLSCPDAIAIVLARHGSKELEAVSPLSEAQLAAAPTADLEVITNEQKAV